MAYTVCCGIATVTGLLLYEDEEIGWLVVWLVGWLIGWLVGWLVGWLAGWLVCFVGFIG